MVRRRAFLAASLVWVACMARAEADDFGRLVGNSIVAEYTETVVPARGQPFQQTWRETLYISTKSRVFHRQRIDSPNPANVSRRDVVGESDGSGGGARAKFAWTGSGFSRQWPHWRGFRLRQDIHVSGDQCRLEVTRSAYPHATFNLVSQSCRITPGNVLAKEV